MSGSTSKKEDKPKRSILRFFRRCFKSKRKVEEKKIETKVSVRNQKVKPVPDKAPVHRVSELDARVRELERRLRIMNKESMKQKENFKQKQMSLEKSLSDAQLKHQKALNKISQLEREKSELKNSVDKSYSKVRERSHSSLQSDELQTEYYQLQKAHEALLREHEEMNQMMLQKDKILEESLADAELKYQMAQKYISQLEEEKSELMNFVYKLSSVVQQLKDDLSKAQHDLEELEIVNTAYKSKHTEALETIHQLREEKSELKKSVRNSKVQELGHSRLQQDELQTKYDQLQKAHRALLLENEELNKLRVQKDETLKILAESELKHQKDQEYITQLEKEKSELENSMIALRSTVQELGEDLFHTHIKLDDLQIEYDEQEDAHETMLHEHEETISQLEIDKLELTKQLKQLQGRVQKRGNGKKRGGPQRQVAQSKK